MKRAVWAREAVVVTSRLEIRMPTTRIKGRLFEKYPDFYPRYQSYL